MLRLKSSVNDAQSPANAHNIPRPPECQGGRGGLVPWAPPSELSRPISRWGWQGWEQVTNGTKFIPNSGSTALWGMAHSCQKTIKKPLAGNASAKPAPDTATGCTFTCEWGMQQPWSGEESPIGLPGPAPALSAIHFIVFNFIVCYFILFYFIPFYFTLLYSILLYSILFNSVLF